MIEVKCKQCNKKFKVWPSTIKNGGGKYCSKRCYDDSKKGKIPWNKGKKGIQKSWNKGLKGETITKKCPACNKEFIVTPSQKNKIYCSQKCYGIGRKMFFNKYGYLNTPQTRKKIIKAKTGTKHTEESKKKMSIAHKGIPTVPCSKEKKIKISKANSGKNNGQWNGGITPKHKRIRTGIEYKLWRNSVLSRDGWTCKKCNTKSDKMRAHHIKNFSQFKELRFAIDNGISFCEKCHKKFHKKYGIQNNNQEQINDYIQIK